MELHVRGLASAAVLLAMTAMLGCTDDNDPGSSTATPARDAPKLIVNANEGEASAMARFEGIVQAEDCVVLRGGGVESVAIWPPRTRLMADGVELDGQYLRFGSTVVLGGGEVKDPQFLKTAGADKCGPDVGFIVGSIAN